MGCAPVFLFHRYLDEAMRRKDVSCYPPYMKGFGYVLSSDLVALIGEMGAGGSLRVYPNDDLMVGLWLLGHEVLVHAIHYAPHVNHIYRHSARFHSWA